MRNTNAQNIITWLVTKFATRGLPSNASSDNGPKFVAAKYRRSQTDKAVACAEWNSMTINISRFDVLRSTGCQAEIKRERHVMTLLSFVREKRLRPYAAAMYRACKSRARKRGWGQLGAGGIYSMLTYRTLFCFGRNNRTVPK